MTQCNCKTNDGSRCKNVANPKSTHGYCTIHNKKDKMRCVSLARKSIGYRSPKTKPTHPRKSKSKSRSKSKSKSAKKSKSKSRSRSKSH